MCQTLSRSVLGSVTVPNFLQTYACTYNRLELFNVTEIVGAPEVEMTFTKRSLWASSHNTQTFIYTQFISEFLLDVSNSTIM